VMRMQQGAIQIKMNLGMAHTTLNLVDSLQEVPVELPPLLPFRTDYADFNPRISIDKLKFRYPNSNFSFQYDQSVQIESGESFAIVGPSGSGKTTLVDLLLGILEPNSGSVRISGLSSQEALIKFPGAIAYVPQDVQIVSGSVRDNICLGYDSADVPESEIWRAAEVAQLSEFIINLPMGLDTAIGESGTNLSGGQRQRLGIARALLTNPKLLVMDEATSSLDSQTEDALSNAIRALSGRTTLVIIAHRLSTVRDADQVCYVREGRIAFIGTFEEVRNQVPEFATQAQIMGL
jgi:ABC-type multidrug transport system fused ATPase/permease subunit